MSIVVLQIGAMSLLLGSGGATAQPQAPASPRLAYAAVHGPQFIPAAEATFISGDDRVIGVMSGGTPKAYPAGILSQHGLVEDDTPSGPIAVTW